MIKSDITYEEFEKIDLRVGIIEEAVEVVESKKLIKLKVNIGEETRQMVAGIKGFYKCEELTGKHVAVLVNLSAKKLMGIESYGMVLAASENDTPVILSPLKPVSAGTIIK